MPIGEAMVACVIADHYLRQGGQMGERPLWPFPRARYFFSRMGESST